MEKIKPCPFCGGVGRLEKIPSDPNAGVGVFPDWFRVVCTSTECHAQGPAIMIRMGGGRNQGDKAIVLWNRRL